MYINNNKKKTFNMVKW